MTIDPRELQRIESRASAKRDPVPPCRSCGYDLAGMFPGDQCPECGAPIPMPMPIARRGRVVDDHITLAPLSYLRTLRWGAVFLALAAASSITPVVLAVIGLGPSDRAQQFWSAATQVVAVVAIWLVTMPRQTPITPASVLRRERFVTRSFARTSAVVSLMLDFLLLSGVTMGGFAVGSRLAELLALGVLAFFLLGLCAMLSWMDRLASWAHDKSLVDQIRIAIGLLIVGGGFLLISMGAGVFGISLGPLSYVFLTLALMTMLFCFVLVVVITIKFALLTGASVGSAVRTQERDMNLLLRRGGPAPLKTRPAPKFDDEVHLLESGSHATGQEVPSVIPIGKLMTIQPLPDDEPPIPLAPAPDEEAEDEPGRA